MNTPLLVRAGSFAVGPTFSPAPKRRPDYREEIGVFLRVSIGLCALIWVCWGPLKADPTLVIQKRKRMRAPLGRDTNRALRRLHGFTIRVVIEASTSVTAMLK